MGIRERKEREREHRRNEIIDAAEKIFFAKGISNATMDDVAEAAELSKGTLYIYFLSKEDLHFAICLRGLDIMAGELQKAYDENLTGAQNAFETAKAYMHFVDHFPDYFNAIMSFESSSLDNVDPAYRSHILKPDSPLMAFVKVVEKGGMDGTIRQDIPAKELAVLLWSQVNGVLQFLRYKPDFLELMGCTKEDLLIHQLFILKDGIIRSVV
ncbi:MAG: TetR/AcrR family transcriptional regulator [Bacteroidales bacterium]|nr:TetR/AcrR family transcriptional regulator [Bacteroidales bacterium]